MRRLRWRRAGAGELPTIVDRLAGWPAPAGGVARHLFALSAIESYGHDPIRIAADADRWAVAVVFPGRLVVPCGDAEAVRAAGTPARRWRLLVGDPGPCDAVLDRLRPAPGLVVHDQRYLTIDPDRVPGEAELPDPGLRRAVPADLPALARLAVQLHIDDHFGPDPGRAGFQGYRDRLTVTVRQGLVYAVGPVGAPVLKIERSVSSRRWGVQLAGIVADPTVRGAGLGRAAVATAVRAALRDPGSLPPEQRSSGRVVSLHVRTDNAPALAAYAAAGFVDREPWRLAVRR